MWEKLKAAGRYIAIIAALIAAFIGGLASAFALRGNNNRQSGLAGNPTNSIDAAAGLGKLEVNQQSASHRIADIADDNRSASAIIDSAEAKLDQLDSILGKYKDD